MLNPVMLNAVMLNVVASLHYPNNNQFNDTLHNDNERSKKHALFRAVIKICNSQHNHNKFHTQHNILLSVN